MTDENRRANLKENLERAGQALAAAETLVAAGLHADAVSRAYYGAYHMLRTLLLTEGLEPKTHRGAIHLFNVHFVLKGLFSSAHNGLLAKLQRSRELADYDSAVVFSGEDAREDIVAARRFEAYARAFLASGGWVGA